MSNVIIYSSNTCGYCTLAKEYLQEKGVSYEEKNISTDPIARKELMQKGYMGVPVIVVNGEEIVGFDKARLEELL
ncbi:MAG: glutaredoxin family protein [Tissierellales bacterium]